MSSKEEIKVCEDDLSAITNGFLNAGLTIPASLSSLSTADHLSTAYAFESKGDHLSALYHWYYLAKSGSPLAFFRLGNRLNWGWFLPKNPSLALRLYQAAAKEGNQYSIAILPQFAFDGHPVNMNHSLTLLTEIHQKKETPEKDIDSEYFYASLLENKLSNDIASGSLDMGKPSDKTTVRDTVAEIVSIYEGLSDNINHGLACMNLSYLYEKKNNRLDYFIEPNAKKRYHYLLLAAKSGYSYAYYDLAQSLLKGQGCDKHVPEAIKFFEKSIEKKLFESAAYRELSLIYLQDQSNGGMIKKDERKSVDALNKAVELGDAIAMQLLGSMYYYGNSIIQQDIKKALELYQKAGELGNSTGYYLLGNLYQSGAGMIEIDEKKSADYFKQASDLGHAEALYRLGVCYQLGRGVKKDREKAVQSFKKAYRIGKLEDAKLALESLGVYN